MNAQVKKIAAGDTNEYAVLYERYYQRVLKYVSKRSYWDEAEDLAADVFEKVLKSLRNRKEGFYFETDGAFEGWLFRIAQNEIVSFHRHDALEKRRGLSMDFEMAANVIPEMDPSISLEDQVVNTVSFEELLPLIDVLSKAQREVITCRFLWGLNIAETAEQLGKNETNVKVLQHKGVKRLRKLAKSPV